MKTRQLLISLTLGLGLTLAQLWLLGGTVLSAVHAAPSQCSGQRPLLQAGDVITVCLSGGCDYASIQDAVDAADSGDEILVATGTYTGVGARAGVTQVVYISKTVTIRGGYTTTNWTTPYPITQPTTLDAQGQGRVLYITGAPSASSGQAISPAIEGLRITGGNTADYGGGVYVITATATISNNQVFSNTAHGGGGLVLAFSAATLYGNILSYNVADGGGGLDLVASNATLSSNIVTSNTAYFWGGGLYMDQGSNATLINNVVADNWADSQGSGLYIRGSSPRLLHTTIACNTGGDGNGVCVTSYTHWQGTTYTTYYSAVALTNTILVSHTMGITVAGGNTATLEATLWGTGSWANDTDWGGTGTIITGAHNYWSDPAFVEPNSGDYHIGATSAAIDKGVNTEVTTDIDGEVRPNGCFFDIGADEFVTGVACKYIYLPLIMRQYP
jgi:hypothetical protein